MSRVCEISGKRFQTGNNVSHAKNKRKKRFSPNLVSKRIFDPSTGEWVRVKISTRALRTLSKKGASAVLKEARKLSN